MKPTTRALLSNSRCPSLFDHNQGGYVKPATGSRRPRKNGGPQRCASARPSRGLSKPRHRLPGCTGIQRDVLPAAEEAFQVATEGYRQGKFGFLDVLDAQRTLFETKGQYLDAFTYHKAVADTERLIGEPLGAVSRMPAPMPGEKR